MPVEPVRRPRPGRLQFVERFPRLLDSLQLLRTTPLLVTALMAALQTGVGVFMYRWVAIRRGRQRIVPYEPTALAAGNRVMIVGTRQGLTERKSHQKMLGLRAR
jgi:hypothetical protein